MEALLGTYTELQDALAVVFGGELTTSDSQDTPMTSTPADDPASLSQSTTPSLQATIESTLAAQQQAQQAAQAERERQEREMAAAKEEERLQELRRQQEAEEAQERQRQQEMEELNRRAEASRAARRQVEQTRERQEQAEVERDRAWEASIPKGTDSVREQLRVLREATAQDQPSRSTALSALHTLFSQIVARPEETNFRRIRRDHPRFQQDIGRHAGGREVLLAAGFRLGKIDEIPSFISSEPNIEKDMDGWAAWFDLLKDSLAIIEEEMITHG